MQVLFGPGHGIPERWLRLRGLRVLLFTALHLASRAGTQAAPTAGYAGWVGKRQLTPGFPHSADSQDGKKKKKRHSFFGCSWEWVWVTATLLLPAIHAEGWSSAPTDGTGAPVGESTHAGDRSV